MVEESKSQSNDLQGLLGPDEDLSGGEQAPGVGTPTYMDKAIAFARGNPFVPLGMIGSDLELTCVGLGATALSLVGATQNMRNPDRVHTMLRLRVWCQGFTVVALLFGSQTWSAMQSAFSKS
jgi:hypothetical protein